MGYLHILVERELERWFPPKHRRCQCCQPRAPIDYPARTSSHNSCTEECSILQRPLPCYLRLEVQHSVGSSMRQLAIARLERGIFEPLTVDLSRTWILESVLGSFSPLFGKRHEVASIFYQTHPPENWTHCLLGSKFPIDLVG